MGHDYYDECFQWRAMEAKKLEELIAARNQELSAMKRVLEDKQRTCSHDWTVPRYTPIVREAYQSPGDAPGTMGVDWRGPVFVPRQEFPMWTRGCKKCNKHEATSQTIDDIRKVPVFK